MNLPQIWIEILSEIYWILKTLLNLKKSVVVATHDTIFDDLPFPNRVIEIEDGRVGKS